MKWRQHQFLCLEEREKNSRRGTFYVSTQQLMTTQKSFFAIGQVIAFSRLLKTIPADAASAQTFSLQPASEESGWEDAGAVSAAIFPARGAGMGGLVSNSRGLRKAECRLRRCCVLYTGPRKAEQGIVGLGCLGSY